MREVIFEKYSKMMVFDFDIFEKGQISTKKIYVSILLTIFQEN